MCAGRFQLPLPTLASSSEPRPSRSQGYQQAGCGGTGHKLNSQKCVCMGGRCLLPPRTWDLETSYTLAEESRWKSLYSTQIHGSSGPVLTHAFPTTYPGHYHKEVSRYVYSQAGCGRVLPCPQLSQGSMPRSQLSTSCILMTV